MKQLINLTPHAITLKMGDGVSLVLPPSGTVARVDAVTTPAGTVAIGDAGRIAVTRRTFGKVINLPKAGGPFVVSTMVLAAVHGRRDVFAPDTGPTAIRDDDGNIVSVTRLVAA